MSKLLTIVCEYRVEVPDSFDTDHVKRSQIKAEIEGISQFELSTYLHSLGLYTDNEVTTIRLMEEHDVSN